MKLRLGEVGLESLCTSLGEISHHLAVIAESTAEIAKKSPLDNPLFTIISGAFVAAFAAYIFTHLHWAYTRKRENICSAALSLTNLVNSLEQVSVMYWLSAHTNRSEIIKAQEIEITALLKGQIGLFKQLSRMLNDKSSSQKLSQLNANINEVFDLVSGGAFKASVKSSDYVVASKISHHCAAMRNDLSSIIFEV